MKTLFLSVPYGMSARNFLRSDVFRTLREHCRLVVLTPLAKDPAFLQEFSHPNATFVAVERNRSLILHKVIELLAIIQTYFFTKDHPIETLLMLKNQLKKENPLRYAAYAAFANTVGRLPVVVRWLETISERLQRNTVLLALFEKHRPVLVFLTHPFVQEELEIALCARSKNVPALCMVHSWDNLTSKSGLRQLTSPQVGRVFPASLFERVVVWNEVLAEELVELYGYPRERIFLSGIPQFDIYAEAGKMMSRQQFFSDIGADPAKKLIYFLATSPFLIHDQTLAVKTLVEALRKGRFGVECQLLIRFHPRTDMSEWAQTFKGADVFFQTPSSAYTLITVPNEWKAEHVRVDNFAESLLYCDVVINGMSTTSIDAAWFDKPTVCFAFDGDVSNNPMMPVYYGNTHYKKLLALEGVRVAWSPAEMIDRVRAYLADPALDAAGRKRIRDRYIYRLDGKSGDRVARYLLEFASIADSR